MKFSTYETTLIYFPLLSRAHHTQKTGRLAFSLREHEGEVKA